MAEDAPDARALELATELTVAWLSNPNTRASADEVPAFLGRMHQALGSLSTPTGEDEPQAQDEIAPAVSVRKSLASKEHIISLIDGKPYKTLRRHLSGHGMTPDQYRERFGLRPDYPMVSAAYSQVRRDMAYKIGLGGKARRGGRGSNAAEAPPAPAGDAKPKQPRGRKKADVSIG